MNRPTEYQVLKRLLFARKDIDPDFDGRDANTIIQDSCMAAVMRLEPNDRDWILAEAAKLETACHWLGEKGSLEVLAAIAPYLNGRQK